MSEWTRYCIDHGYTERMNVFLPESHWTPQRHQSVSRWMAWGSGESDDGVVHSRNYYTRNLIQTAEIMVESANKSGIITSMEANSYAGLLLNAKKHLWLAQVTDTSGVNPNALEFQYAINHTYYSQQICQSII